MMLGTINSPLKVEKLETLESQEPCVIFVMVQTLLSGGQKKVIVT